MNFDTYSYFAGFLSALVVITIGHFLTKSRTNEAAERNRLHNASDKFRAAIAKEIALWQACANNPFPIIHTDNNPITSLEESSITAAVIEFRPFVANNTKKYNRTHATYEYHKKNNSSKVSFEYYRQGVEFLEELLRFAKK